MSLPTSPARHVVLVVDGNASRARQLLADLRSAGCSVSWATSGAEALRLVLESQPDAVVADWDLPDVGGPALTRRLKSQRLAAKVILAKDAVDWRDLREAFEAAADDVLTRPLAPAALLGSLERRAAWTDGPCKSSSVASA